MESDHKYHAVIIPDEFSGYSTCDFRLSQRYSKYIEGILVPRGMILDRLEKMALDILDNLERRGSTSLTLLCILKGAFKFAADLCEKLEAAAFSRQKNITIHLDFIVANTYVNDRVGHETRLSMCSDPGKYENKDLLVVEDLVDTGTTLHKLYSYLKALNPRSIEVACLLVKRRQDCVSFYPDYVGFEVPDRFIVGYSIDYSDHFRELPHICVVNDQGKKQFAVRE
ncbi:hypothetical protein CRM22_001618 [Opisthorchis felineus]|uniref:Phosphoribosyltransferase domain-containing protein n=1 Tax=Opisthorchis felineus TaxID=147828 RepID=A0A4S2M9S9_OPIFE|nr:hypothetical protein CRM22_001618 [Opisthorchis felineus]TGZ73262.1 hypothetical protein CRM22_001618 [Opisthorchis felineus]